MPARSITPALALLFAATASAQLTERELFERPDKGHCIACHQVPAGAGKPTGSDLGPALTGTRMRELGKPALRALLHDPTQAKPDTVMPPYGRHRILDAREIERLVDYLHKLPADSTPGAAPADPDPSEQAAQNAAAAKAATQEGQKIWLRKFRNGRTLSACFPNGGRRVAATYPQYDTRLKRVVTLEMAINQCLKTHGEPLLDQHEGAMAAVTAYVRSLAEKQKVAVRVPAGGEARFEDGRRLYFSRLGQANFACASCHVQGVGRRYDGQVLSPANGHGASWPYVRAGQPLTLQMRMRECLERMGAAPFPAGSEELNHLEYYLTFQSNGLPLQPKAARP